jgi:hypothetical protein
MNTMALRYVGEQRGVGLYADVNLLFEALKDEQREIEQERREQVAMSVRYHCSLPKKQRQALMREMLQKRRAEQRA